MTPIRVSGFIPRQLILSFLLIGLLTACQVRGEDSSVNLPSPNPASTEDNHEAHFLENIDMVSMNHIDLKDSSASEYQFVVVGHIYGSFEDGAPHPAETLMQNLSMLKDRDISLMVSMGDTVRNATEADFEDLEKDLFSQIDFPIINAVGNHDMRDRDLYQSRYGMTYYAFQYGPAEMIVLDTEVDVCKIPKEQREMLKGAIEQALANPEIRQIFIFLHKAVFANDETLYDNQSTVAMPNEWKCYDATNYPNIVKNILLPAAQQKPVYVFGGDVGATGGNLSPYYHEYIDGSLTEMAVGIGDKPQDAVLFVSVKGGQVDIEPISLTGKPMRDLEDYNLEYWQDISRK